MCDKHNNEPETTATNNNFEIETINDNQQQQQQINEQVNHQQLQLDNSLKSSIYDWDSPSSSTGTVKRRPHTIANFECSHTNRKTADKRNSKTEKEIEEIITNNNVAAECQNNSKQKPNHITGHIRRQGINNITANKQSKSASITIKVTSHLASAPLNMQKSSRSSSSSSNNKEKPQKLRLNKTSDRNANSTSNSPTHNTQQSSTLAATLTTSQGGIANKSLQKRSKYNCNDSHGGEISSYQDENYMEFEFFEREIPNRQLPQFTELFRDFPVSYETTTLALQASTLPAKPPPFYREPPPPTPPPLSQLPSRSLRQNENTQSCPSTPFRGKVVLSKKERKELSKLNKLQDTNCSNSIANIRGFESPAASVPSSPYKGRVTELKNCIARINSKGLFASLHRHSQKTLNNQTPNQDEQATSSSNEVSPPPPAPDTSPPGSNASNNNDSDYTEKLKNLPVRKRKGHTSHMDNYCLFDPMDFVNEKELRRRTHESLNMDLPLPQQQQGLRDPLFSSRQNLDFSEEEMVPEVIYDGENDVKDVEFEVEVEVHQRNFDHHNYFVIDPEDFEEEPQHDIGIPNPFSNEQLVQANLIAHTQQQQHIYANNPEEFKSSASLEKLLSDLETVPSMSNSQESKDTTTTTSTALVESSTSTNSNTSSTSNTSSQTTLQRTKKKLTFLNLSPFRSNKTFKEKSSSSSSQNSQPKQERAISELVTSEHMLHLQRMLLSAENVLNDTRPINENIELNYVLFNPGPVPSRNVQYKIRKPRPLSTHSDADSGFLSPCSPDEFSAMKFSPALLVLQQCDSVQGYIEVSFHKSLLLFI